jgi:riboflavin-specific deaminase-like protein
LFTSCYISIVISDAQIKLNRLYPPGEPAQIEEIVTGLGLLERSLGAPKTTASAAEPPHGTLTSPSGQGSSGPDPQAVPDASGITPGSRRTQTGGRPYVVLNMVSTLDGRATVNGRSGAMSGAADRALFHGLRMVVDAVMAGAGTVRAERYGPLVRDAEHRRERVRLGLSERPLACVVSAGLAFPPDLPLLADPDSQVAILTAADGRLSETGVAATVKYVCPRREDGSLNLEAALAQLRERMGVGTLLCEGGPHLNGELIAAGLVDELFLSVSPLLAGDDLAEEGFALRILAGVELPEPERLRLLAALEHESHLFLRYSVAAADPAAGSAAG